MGPGHTDADLVAAFRGGDRAALGSIYDRYADQLYDTARAMLGDPHEAADALQDTFVAAATRLDQLRDPDRLRAWLFAILRNAVYRRSDRRRRTVPTDLGQWDMSAPRDPAAGPEALAVDDAATADLASAVRAAAAGLDARDQLVLELSARQGLDGVDLAEALGVSVAQSHVLVHRMRQRVARSLGAVTVARMGRRDCPDLASLLSGWDGTFSVLVRKRVARHIDACTTCEQTSRRYAVAPLFAAAPAWAAPADLRARVLAEADQVLDGRSPRPGNGRSRWARRAAVALGAAASVALIATGTAAVAGRGEATSPAALAPSSSALTSPPPAIAITTTAIPATTPPPTTTTEPATTTTAGPAPSTTEATVDPPTTASSAVTTVPGRLGLSLTSLDLGSTIATDTVAVSNTGGASLDWTLDSSAAGPFSVAAVVAPLAPGQTATITVGLDRSGLAEGDVNGSVVVRSGGGTQRLRLSGRVEHRPTVSIVNSPSLMNCPSSVPALVLAAVSDESPLAAVSLEWTGPGPSGQVAMTLVAGTEWRGNAGLPPVNGTWTLTVRASDVRGNVGTASRPIVRAGC